MLRWISGLGLVVATLIAACGDNGSSERDENRARLVVEGYLAAVAERDGIRACRYLTRNAQLGVFEFKRAHIGTDHPAAACAAAVRREGPRTGQDRLRTAKASDIRISGKRAEAQVGRYPVTLEKVGASWKIATFGLASDVAGAVQPFSS